MDSAHFDGPSAIPPTLEETEAARCPTATVDRRRISSEDLLERWEVVLPSIAGDETSDIVPSVVLGGGGMGTVRLARQRSLDRDVAVKCAAPGSSPRIHHALVHEARVLGALEHPNIVPAHVLGVGPDEAPMLVMKRVSGVSWRTLLGDPGHPLWAPLGGDRLDFHLDVFRQVCNAAHFAHSRGIIHRDIKADNVMIGEYGEVYLVDWGLAMGVGDEPHAQIVGTPSHLAPEMLLGTGPWITPRTDVYLLGATLHEVLTRGPRHARAGISEVLVTAGRSEPVAYGPEVPALLGDLCNAATARDPEDRPATARALRDEVERFLERRAYLTILERAHADLVALRSARGEADPARVYSCFGACASGYAQALGVAPESAEALRGHDNALAAVAEWELDQGRDGAAETFVRQMHSTNEPLQTRLAALRALRHAEAREYAGLREAARARRRTRVVLAAVGGVAQVGLVFLLAFLAQVEHIPLRVWHLALMVAFVWSVIVALSWRRDPPFVPLREAGASPSPDPAAK
jgi:serine/threonine-protein kinase